MYGTGDAPVNESNQSGATHKGGHGGATPIEGVNGGIPPSRIWICYLFLDERIITLRLLIFYMRHLFF